MFVFVFSAFASHLSLNPSSPLSAFESSFSSCDSSMSHSREYVECGSTAQCVYIRVNEKGNRQLFVANVGDAQAFVAVKEEQSYKNQTQMQNHANATGVPFLSSLSLRSHSRHPSSSSSTGYGCIPLSYPHVASDVSEISRIRSSGGYVFMGRVGGCLAVSRAFGDFALKKAGVTVKPYTQQLTLNEKHKFIIIGCDGVWDVTIALRICSSVSWLHWFIGVVSINSVLLCFFVVFACLYFLLFSC